MWIAKRMTAVSGLIALALMMLGCSQTNEPPAETKRGAAAPDAPVTKGYESAIASKPLYRPSGSAPAIWGPGDLYYMLVRGEESNQALFQFEANVPPNGGPPAHVHNREDESFYIVSGELEILLGDKTYLAKKGDFVYVPRGTVHRFKNVGTDMAVQLVTFAPAGMDKFFEEVFTPTTDTKSAPPPVTDELIKKMNEAAPRYGLTFPLPPDSK